MQATCSSPQFYGPYFPLAAVAVKLLPLVSKVPHPQPVASANEHKALRLRDVKGLFWTVPWARG